MDEYDLLQHGIFDAESYRKLSLEQESSIRNLTEEYASAPHLKNERIQATSRGTSSSIDTVKLEEKQSADYFFHTPDLHDYNPALRFPLPKLEPFSSPLQLPTPVNGSAGRMVQSHSLVDLDKMNGGKSSKKKRMKVIRSQENMTNLPANIKNTYINKINSLIREAPAEFGKIKKDLGLANHGFPESITPNPVNSSLKKSRSLYLNQDSTAPPENAKKQRNRQSAKKSRSRKKIYIDMLESKVELLNGQLKEVYGLLEQNMAGLEDVFLNSRVLANLREDPTIFIEELRRVSNNNDEGGCADLLESFRCLLEANKCGRPYIVERFFNQMIEVMTPLQVKFFLALVNASKTQPAIYSALSEDISKNVPDFERCKVVMQANQKIFHSKRTDIQNIFAEMESSKNELIRRSGAFQMLIDEISNNLSPIQISKLILFSDKFRNGDKGMQKQLSAAFANRGRLFPAEEDQPLSAVRVPTAPMNVDVFKTFDLFVQTKEFLKKRKHQEMTDL